MICWLGLDCANPTVEPWRTGPEVGFWEVSFAGLVFPIHGRSNRVPFPDVDGSWRFLYITWVYFVDKTEGTTDRSSQKLCLVVVACNHPNVPSIPFSFTNPTESSATGRPRAKCAAEVVLARRTVRHSKD